MLRRDWAEQARLAERRELIESAVRELSPMPVLVASRGAPPNDESSLAAADGQHPSAATTIDAPHDFGLSAQVFRVEDAEAAAANGATEIVFDSFLRHPSPPVNRLRGLAERLAAQGVAFRLRTPTIVRPEERPDIQKWLDAGWPLLSGHIGLVAELAREGRDVTGDYALNVMNQHTAAEIFALGARRLVLSVELTTEEIERLVAPWHGGRFDAFVYGRPEGMTIEHCVLSAAFDRVPTTCRDLCVKKHTNVELTDPAGYRFPVATDSACRNRLLHSRPVDGSEFLPRLWAAGVRGFQMVFNVVGDPVGDIVAGYAAQLRALARGESPSAAKVRDILRGEFTRGHFARAV